MDKRKELTLMIRRHFPMHGALLCAAAFVLWAAHIAPAQYADWQHIGSMYILTTPEGADLPASASVEDFPLLVRLDRDFFDFSQARPKGEDIRFSTAAGQALPYQIEQWDAQSGSALIWVRIPQIRGNAKQEIRLHWGNTAAPCASNGKAVFDVSNGHLAVWHMNGPVIEDEVGTIKSKDAGTSAAPGMIGPARHFPGGKGVYCGEDIITFPTGSTPHTSSVWFRGAKPNCRILSWGKEYRQGKIQMWYNSPSQIRMDCYFSDADVRSSPSIPLNQWAHVVHTYQKGESRIYINGVLDTEARTRATTLNIERPARMWIGGWYGNFDFIGDIDELRISDVTRSPDWIKLEYENQKALHTLLGPLVKPGDTLSVSPNAVTISEGRSATVRARIAGAQKFYWIFKRRGKETVVAVDQRSYSLDAGRVSGDESVLLQLRALYPDGVRTRDVSIQVTEAIPDPVVSLQAPLSWDGRKTIEIVPTVTNAQAIQEAGAGDLTYDWTISGMAVIQDTTPDKLILTRAQNSGQLTVTLTVSNGGDPIASTATVSVQEPAQDAWIYLRPGKDEKPQDKQFYARDDKNEGTLHYNGSLDKTADAVFLRVYAGGERVSTQTQALPADQTYSFSAKLKAGLVKYGIEFGMKKGDSETVLDVVDNLVCGDAYIIQGQSNAEAWTDKRVVHPFRSDWLRSFGTPITDPSFARTKIWGNAISFNGGENRHKLQIGYWGVELGKQLIEQHKIPIFVINGAQGGTRVDQHQRNASIPTDVNTIYGRLLWRLRQAGLTHGIRAVLWHQGENDQGAAGPSGTYGWVNYQRYFTRMAGSWKQDYPNILYYYIFQIWPGACGTTPVANDRLRNAQRMLPSQFSNMSIMSTLGIRPGSGCHYTSEGYRVMAHLILPLVNQYNYGIEPEASITPPDIKAAYYTSERQDEIALEFDQAVTWDADVVDRFYVDGEAQKVVSASDFGRIIILKLADPCAAKEITYVKGGVWRENQSIIRGMNGVAALTFCDVSIQAAGPKP
jgi:hypothetical protein